MKLKNRESIPELIREMTLEEKVFLLTGASIFKGNSLEKYGIPETYYLDGGTGANYQQMVWDIFGILADLQGGDIFEPIFAKMPTVVECLLDPEKEKTLVDPMLIEIVPKAREMMKKYLPNGELPGCFPPGIVFGSTWDPQNVYESGRALGKEAQFYGIDVLLGSPNVNIHRDPRGGRLFEGYSEDPCLVSKLAPAFVRGVQDEGIIADVKHFAANNQETDRRTVNEHIPVRALQEIYFPGFKACVQDGGAKTVMCAYNYINGVPCSADPWLLTKILKEDWGFEGYLVSDWCAMYDQVESYRAGMDMDMPGPRNYEKVLEAVRSGDLSEENINDHVRRLLNVMLDMPAMKGRPHQEHIDREGSARAAYNSVKEAIVLLKNENDVLPLPKSKGVCFFGEKSKNFLICGGGSANVVTSEDTSMYESMQKILGTDHVTYEKITDDTQTVIITVGIIGQEGFDRADLEIDAKDKTMLLAALKEAKAAGKKTVVILNVAGPVDVSDFEADVDAILCIFIPGMEGGHAVADALAGKFSPSGKLPITFPMRYRDCPTAGNFPGRNEEVWYGEGIFVGYRYYDYKEIVPRYPFGYGLSYTSFHVSDIKADKNILDIDRDDDVIRVTALVENTGNMTGKEVVQLYIGEQNPAIVKPVKELKNFCKVEVAPGEKKEVVLEIKKEMLKSYDDVTASWIAQPDLYTIYIGTSSRDIAGTVEIDAQGWNAYGVKEETPVGILAAIPGALQALADCCPAGLTTREAMELQMLFLSTQPLGTFWKSGIENQIDASDEEKEAIYRNMLKVMNRFSC